MSEPIDIPQVTAVTKPKRNAHQLKRPIIVTCNEWIEPKKYNSNYRASKDLNINPSTIAYACKHNRVVKRDNKTYTFKFDVPFEFGYEHLVDTLKRHVINIRNTVKQNFKLSAKKQRAEYFTKCIEQVRKYVLPEDQRIILIRYFEHFIKLENEIDPPTSEDEEPKQVLETYSN